MHTFIQIFRRWVDEAPSCGHTGKPEHMSALKIHVFLDKAFRTAYYSPGFLCCGFLQDTITMWPLTNVPLER